MIQKIDHIGIAVPNIREATRFYTESLGAPIYNIEKRQSQNLVVTSFPMGDTTIELLEPQDGDSYVGRFLKSNGPGVHHIAFVINNFADEIMQLQRQGVKISPVMHHIDQNQMRQSVFLHPKSSWGVLIQLLSE